MVRRHAALGLHPQPRACGQARRVRHTVKPGDSHLVDGVFVLRHFRGPFRIDVHEQANSPVFFPQSSQQAFQLPVRQVHAHALHGDDRRRGIGQFLQFLCSGCIQRLHAVAFRLPVIAPAQRQHVREIRVDPPFVRPFHPQAAAVHPAPDLQHQRLRLLGQHLVGPVVKHPGPHRHIVGQPPGGGLAPEGECFFFPDLFRLRVLQEDAFPAHLRFAVQRDKQRPVHRIHSVIPALPPCRTALSPARWRLCCRRCSGRPGRSCPPGRRPRPAARGRSRRRARPGRRRPSQG